MRRVVWIGVLCLLTVGGCSKPAADHRAASDAASEPVRPELAAKATPQAAKAPAVHAPSAPMLAYSYRYGLDVPPGRVVGLMRSHEQACRAAGPAVCQVTSSTTETNAADLVSAKLELRAAPDWLQNFRDGLARDATEVGGRVSRSSVESEDLTRQIVDTDAALRAKTLLGARLETLLQSRPGKLSELVELERELARVQGEIDATRSELAVMRTRVDTSSATLEYASRAGGAGESTFRPLGEALRGSLGALVKGLAALIWAAAFLTPFVLALWAVLWIRRRARPMPGGKPLRDPSISSSGLGAPEL